MGTAGGRRHRTLLYWRRVWILIGLVVVGLAGLLAVDPIPQDPGYHLFADSRTFLGIPNFNDVLSNAGFSVAGVLGVLATVGRKRRDIFVNGTDAWPYAV